jgi:RNA polymerase sigma-70 factor (ECF subfamily)
MAKERDAPAHAAAENVARHSYGKLVAFLAARSRDVTAAEDALADAFAAALAVWPVRGVPDNPEAWLLTAARRKAIDGARKRRRHDEASPHLILMADEMADTAPDAIPDRRLGLMFACAHPAIEAAMRAPLILQTVLGFDAGVIASAFLVAPAAMRQRLVRAKTKIRGAGIAFRVPEHDELGPRLDTVLEAIYAVYAEGWSGIDLQRRNLADEAIWLGRLVVSLLPEEPEALGLLALMLHSEARRAARRDGGGDFVPLAEQDTALWDATQIEEAEMLLHRASALGVVGRFQLEAAVQSAHNVRRVRGTSDWRAVLALYDALLALTGSPVVAINRAVALAEVEGAATGLEALDAVADDPRLAQHQPTWAARAALLARAGRIAEADEAYAMAIGLETDNAVRTFLLRKRAALTARH